MLPELAGLFSAPPPGHPEEGQHSAGHSPSLEAGVRFVVGVGMEK